MKTARRACAPGETIAELTDPEPAPIHDHSASDPNKARDEAFTRIDLSRFPEKDSPPFKLFRVSLWVGDPRPNVLEQEITVNETAFVPATVHLLGVKVEGESLWGPARFLAKESFELTLPLSALFWRKQVGD